ncbi:MAG: DNA-3-methyladenine glycosylase 2 family protein [Actinobacteria bacterium]|nr:DNA-3-methyladenine glycosylase 2 family protein [Actinomycetota bacterium]
MRRAGPSLDTTSFVSAVEHLVAQDPPLATVVDTHGLPPMWRRPPGFPALVLFILEQQVSLASGKAVFDRLRDELGAIEPARAIAAGPTRIRGVGVTRQKTGYIIGLAEAIISGEVDIDGLGALDDHTARERLLGIKGVGRWTADVYLLSCLLRPDAWPVGDRALQVGVGELLGTPQIPDQVELEEIGERWRPYRAVAARLVWHNYLRERGRAETEVAGL